MAHALGRSRWMKTTDTTTLLFIACACINRVLIMRLQRALVGAHTVAFFCLVVVAGGSTLTMLPIHEHVILATFTTGVKCHIIKISACRLDTTLPSNMIRKENSSIRSAKHSLFRGAHVASTNLERLMG